MIQLFTHIKVQTLFVKFSHGKANIPQQIIETMVDGLSKPITADGTSQSMFCFKAEVVTPHAKNCLQNNHTLRNQHSRVPHWSASTLMHVAQGMDRQSQFWVQLEDCEPPWGHKKIYGDATHNYNWWMQALLLQIESTRLQVLVISACNGNNNSSVEVFKF